jgi:hypothetical protein
MAYKGREFGKKPGGFFQHGQKTPSGHRTLPRAGVFRHSPGRKLLFYDRRNEGDHNGASCPQDARADGTSCQARCPVIMAFFFCRYSMVFRVFLNSPGVSFDW